MKCQMLFLGQIRKLFHTVIYCLFYPAGYAYYVRSRRFYNYGKYLVLFYGASFILHFTLYTPTYDRGLLSNLRVKCPHVNQSVCLFISPSAFAFV